MDEGRAREDLAETVEAHLSRKPPDEIKLGMLVYGLGQVQSAAADLAERRGDWGSLLARAREAKTSIDAALQLPAPIDEGLGRFARRESAFASLLADEILRLQADETTLA